MKTRKSNFALFLGLFILALAFVTLGARPAHAQMCTDPTTGHVYPCGGSGDEEKKRKTPTDIPPTRTPTPTSSPTPTTTPAGIPLTGGEASGAVPAGVGGTPAVQLRAFAAGSFLIGLLILVLLVGGVFVGRYILSSPRHTAPIGRNDGFVQQVDLSPGATDPADYVLWRKGIDPSSGTPNHISTMQSNLQPPADPGVPGNDLAANTDPQSADYVRWRKADFGQGSESPGHDLGENLDTDHEGLNQNWEQQGNIDGNTDGTEAAD